MFKISFLPKCRVICYDYIVKWCSGIGSLCNWFVSLDNNWGASSFHFSPLRLHLGELLHLISLLSAFILGSFFISFLSSPPSSWELLHFISLHSAFILGSFFISFISSPPSSWGASSFHLSLLKNDTAINSWTFYYRCAVH